MLEGVWEPKEAPFVHVRRVGSQVICTGMPDARLGHRIALPDGSDGGNWAEWHWDGDRLLVANDRFRGYPLFYAADADGVAVSPSIDALLALGIDRRLDLDAIAAFLTLGYYLGTDTPFAAIRLLPAGVGFAWAPGKLTIEASSPPTPRPEPLSRAGRRRRRGAGAPGRPALHPGRRRVRPAAQRRTRLAAPPARAHRCWSSASELRRRPITTPSSAVATCPTQPGSQPSSACLTVS